MIHSSPSMASTLLALVAVREYPLQSPPFDCYFCPPNNNNLTSDCALEASQALARERFPCRSKHRPTTSISLTERVEAP